VNFVSFPVFRLSGKVTREDTNIPIAGVSIRATSEFGTNTVSTDVNGGYAFAALRQGDYVITPSLAGSAFEPVTRELLLLTDTAGQNFVGFTAFSISGRVIEAGAGVGGVEVTAAGSTNPIIVAVTDNNGNYTLNGLRPDTYSLYPVRPGYNITPQPFDVKVGPSANNVNFSAAGVLTVNGTVREGTNRLAGISLVLTSTNPPSIRSVITDTNGNYIFTNLSPRVYVLTPQPSVSFVPTNAVLELLDYTTIDFDASAGKLILTRTPTNLLLRLNALPRRTYTIQAGGNPTALNWTNYLTVLTDTNGIFERLEIPVTNAPGRFYRTKR
jgi:carboxypeptidase family protein